MHGRPDTAPLDLGFLAGGGEMGERIRRHDWAATPLGPAGGWPQPLKTLVGVMLGSNQPMFVAWGAAQILLYNDAYAEILALKHPEALGRPFLDVWDEIRSDLLPIVEQGYAGQPVHMDDIELLMHRKGYPEETHFAFSYTPVRDESGRVAGIFCPCTEITGQVLAERRQREAEAALRAERDRTRRVLDGMAEGYGLLDREFRVIDINAEGLRLEARPREAILGKTHWEAWPGSEESELGRILKRAMAERVPLTLDHRYVWVDGHDAWLELRVYPTDDGLALFWRDVTGRHRIEAALRAERDRSVEILESISDAFYAVDRDWRFTYVNRKAEEWWGRRADDLIGKVYWEEFPQTLGSEAYQAHERAMREGTPARVETVSPILNHWVGIDIHPTAGGGLSVYFRDITEKKQAEERLRESEARFRLMADAVPQIIWITDPDGRTEFFNKQWSDYTGAVYEATTAAEIAANHVHPEDQAATIAAFSEARRTETTFLVEHRIRSASGEYRWFLVRGEPYRDPLTGRIVRWFGASTDIHDRRTAEERLRELNETLELRVSAALAERNMLAKLVEMTDVMVLAIDLDYNILALNAANADEFERIYGIRPKAGDNMLELLSDWPEHQEQVRTGWARGMQGEHVTFVEEFGDPDRARPYYEVNFRPLRNEAGEQIGVYQFVMDVTDRLRREAQLAEAQEALRQSQKMEAMGQLTGGVAHDFNNLLTPIVGALDLLQRKGLGGERERRLTDGALQSAERAKTLVQRLLAFARRQPLQSVAVDIGKLVAGMGDLVSSTTGPQIKVVVEVPDDLPPAKADPNQVEMALLNLAVNARDAMPEGGTLRISASAATVGRGHRSKLKAGRYILLSVADTGVGMDEATLARAVEPFFSTKGIGRGTGLGLSMVHGLASQLGGALTIQSRPGVGTNIELWLPTSAAQAEAGSPIADVAPAAEVRGIALLVDDEELVRMSTADMLTDLGYQVTEASSAEEALRLLNDGLSPDLLITDHLMPGMNGTELARIVKSERPGIKVLIVSGYAETEGIAPDLPRLTKPFRNAELSASLAAMNVAGME